MNTYVTHHPAAASLAWLAQALHGAAQRLDAWLLGRRKSADDEATLVGMSARELRDIGLDPSYAKNDGQGDWVRDWS